MTDDEMGSGDVPASAGAGREHWVELRIHGVSGTPPEAILSTTYAKQVAGERFVRVFRPAGTLYEERRPAPDHVLEVLHWGDFTSGSWRQGLWLLLVPFGLVNAAQFMLPRPSSAWSRFSYFVASALLRLLGLVLTCTLTLAAGLVLMDLVAWRFTATVALAKLLGSNYTVGLAMLATAAVVAFLYSFGTRLGVSRPSNPTGRLAEHESDKTDLARARFLSGDADAPALRRLHLSAGLLVVAYLGFHLVRRVEGSTVARAGEIAAVVLLAATALVATFLGDPEDSASVAVQSKRQQMYRESWRRLSHRVALAVVGAGLALFALAVAFATAQAHVVPSSRRRLPGFAGLAEVVLVVMTLALAALFVATLALALATRTPPDVPASFRRYAGGMTAALTATVGVFLGIGFAAALTNSAASVLDRGGSYASGTIPLLERVSYSSAITLFLIVGLIVAALTHRAVQRSGYRKRAAAAFTFGLNTESTIEPAWIRRVADAMWSARMKVFLPVLFWAFATVGLALCVVVAIETLWNRQLAAPIGWLTAPRREGQLNLLINIGSFSLTTFAALLVLLGRGAIRGKAARRGVNVIWDVVAFWPRSAHPFVPPPYSQRVVLGLRDRVAYHLGTHPTTPNPNPATQVVVAAHSQGTLITFAALLWLRTEELARVGLVTFGSQLQVAFSRGFPTYVNFDAIRMVFRGLEGRWINLYRDTDSIAGPVLSWDHSHDSTTSPPESSSLNLAAAPTYVKHGPDVIEPTHGRRECGNDWRVLDPTPFDLALEVGAIVGIRGHGAYWEDVDWAEAVDAVRPIPHRRAQSGTSHGSV